MTYKVLRTDVPLPHGTKEPDFSKLVPFAFPTLEEAVKNACAFMKHGSIVWRIEGPTGLEMDRPAIEKACGKETLRFTLQPGPIMTSTGGMTHKEHRDRNVRIPRKPAER